MLALVSGCGAGGDDPLLIASGFGFSPPPAPSLGRSEVYSEKSEVRHVRKSCTKQSDISIALKQGVGQAKLPDQDYLHQSRGKQDGTGVTARILPVKPSPAMNISGRRQMSVGTANGERVTISFYHPTRVAVLPLAIGSPNCHFPSPTDFHCGARLHLENACGHPRLSLIHI